MRRVVTLGWESWSAIVCVLLTAVLLYGPYLARVDLFNNDVAHHVFWLYRYADPALFPGDITVDYFKTSALWGYRALYVGVAPMFDLLCAAEWLSLGLLIASAWMAWRIGLLVNAGGSRMHALLMVASLCLLLQVSQQRDLLPPVAFQRSFALPLLLWTLLALAGNSYRAVGVSWIAAALVYPVVLPIQGLTAGLLFTRTLAQQRRMPPSWIFNLAAGTVALVIAGIGVPVPAEIGPALTYEQAMRLPEFGPGGRLRMYGGDGGLYGWLRDHRTGFGWSAAVLALTAAAAALALAVGERKRIPAAAWLMGGIGTLLWASMRAFPEVLMFGLYLPNRHSRWGFGVLAMTVLAAAGSGVVERLRAHFVNSRPDEPDRVRAGIVIGLPVFIAALMLPDATSLWRQPVNRGLEDSYAFVASLPRDTLVAAHPDLANYVPVRTRRSVLTSTEVSMAWMAGYYARMKPRVEASLDAAYATRIEEMDAALAPYGVDVMLTGPEVWSRTKYFAPFDARFDALWAKGMREGFALREPPEDRILFRSGDYYVLRVEQCKPADCP
jgi:hypothetical protein